MFPSVVTYLPRRFRAVLLALATRGARDPRRSFDGRSSSRDASQHLVSDEWVNFSVDTCSLNISTCSSNWKLNRPEKGGGEWGGNWTRKDDLSGYRGYVRKVRAKRNSATDFRHRLVYMPNAGGMWLHTC